MSKVKRTKRGGYWIDPRKLKAQLVSMDYTLKEAAELCGFTDQWLYQSLYRGIMSPAGVEKLEELGIRRSKYVIK